MGNKTIRVLNRVYMGDVCPPRFSCVVPAGTLKSSSLRLGLTMFNVFISIKLFSKNYFECIYVDLLI